MERQTRTHDLNKFLAKIATKDIAWPTKDLRIIKHKEINRFYIPNEIGVVTEFNTRATLEAFDDLLIEFHKFRIWNLAASFEKMFLTKVEIKNKRIIAHWSTNGKPLQKDGVSLFLSDWITFREKIEEKNLHLV